MSVRPLALRPATMADLPAVMALEGESFSRGWSASSWGEEIDRHWVVVADGDPLLGVIAMSCLDDVADLLRVMVAPSSRRQGIGRRLVDDGLEWAGSQGAGSVMLEVSAANLGAIRLYEDCGFGPIARRVGYYGPGDDALVYQRRIDRSPGGPGPMSSQPVQTEENL